jgi:hypothetical protein
LVLQDPERAAGVTFLDGFSPAFLAGLLFPLVSTVVVVMFTGSGRTDLGDSVAALVAGPLLGGSVGLGLWRAAHSAPQLYGFRHTHLGHLSI